MIETPILDIPFSHKSVDIMQGFHGPWSHKELSPNVDLTYAVDFLLPLGTPVLAAENGEVFGVYVFFKYFYEGTDPQVGNNLGFGKTNFIIIKHDNDLFSLYSHLEQYSSVASRGERVTRGQQIARTGKSGWIGPNPHLHFQVIGQDHLHSIPFRLKDYPFSLEHSNLITP